jgi:DNA polymerase-3 subunit delta'
MKFADIPGISELKKNLVYSVDSGHVAHAQLFAGSEGGVGLMLALAYAQYLNCENPAEGDSCGVCFSCIKISKSIHPDVHYCFPFAKTKRVDEEDLNAYLPLFRQFMAETPFGTLADWAALAEFENRTPIINIKAVRETMQGLQLKAYEAKFKVQIIWLPETMRTEGSNSFLKLLEEPPPFTVFLLVSDQAEQLLPTVISRTQRVTVPRMEEELLAGFLVSKFGASESRAQSVAGLSGGSIPVALSLLNEQEDDYHARFMDWQRSCFKNDLDRLIQLTETFQSLGKEMQKTYLKYCLDKVRKAMVLASGGGEVLRIQEKEAGELANLGKTFSLPLITLLSEQLETAYYHIDRNASARMVFFDTSMALASGYKNLRKS